MIFQNPWAWIGLLAVAGPIVAHLLARRPPRLEPFPSLRFLHAINLDPVRRDRLADAGLLVLRALVIAAAVAALARPVWVSGDRARDLGRQIARAIVVDTSASVSRDAARQEADAVAADATTSRTAETAEPAALVDAAVTWLATQSVRRELVVISDFETRAFARADVDRIPGDIGVRLITVPSAPAPGAAAPPERLVNPVSEIQMLAGPAERAALTAAYSAVLTTATLAHGRTDRPVAIVFPEFESREALIKNAQAIDSPWMFDVLRAVVNDPTFRAATERDGVTAFTAVSAYQHLRNTVVGNELVLATSLRASSLAAAALIAATARAITVDDSEDNRHPKTLQAELDSWQRSPGEVSLSRTAAGLEDSHGRWLWAVVLLLLIVELIVRRRRSTRVTQTEVSHAARVA